jgi:hypothetical protein
MSSVAIHDWTVSCIDLAWMVHDDYLSKEAGSFFRRIILRVSHDKSSLHILDGKTFEIEPDVLTWLCLFKSFVMGFN